MVDAEPEVEERDQLATAVAPSTEIEFADLSFTYPGSQEPALAEISFRLSGGESFAIVGPSGSGKTTLLSLLMRFWDYHQGDIFLGDRLLRDYTPDDVRAQFAVVPQQSHFFNTSIRENLSLARPDAGQSEIESAARQAQIHEFITGLTSGYDTQIGERGLRLSGGERQRLAIARALLKKAPILVLDEPTANLDPIIEVQVLETIFSLMRAAKSNGYRRSTLLITHRLVGLENVDEIIVLDLVDNQVAQFKLDPRGLAYPDGSGNITGEFHINIEASVRDFRIYFFDYSGIWDRGKIAIANQSPVNPCNVVFIYFNPQFIGIQNIDRTDPSAIGDHFADLGIQRCKLTVHRGFYVQIIQPFLYDFQIFGKAVDRSLQ